MNKLQQAIIIMLIALSVFFTATNLLEENMYGAQSDEGYYFKYGDLVSNTGLDGFNKLIDWYANNEEARYHPAPIRIGYILPVALLFKIFGPNYLLLGQISFFCFLILLFIFFHYIKKYFNKDIALFSTIMLASSPLTLAMSRRGLIDSAVNLTWGLTIWLFLDFLTTKQKREYIYFLLSFSFAILIKESAIILLPFFLLAYIFYNLKHKEKIQITSIIGTITLPILISGVCFLVVLGGFQNCIAGLKAILATHLDPNYSNTYAMLYSSGPWYRYIIDFLLLAPISTLLFIGYFFHIPTKKNIKWQETYLWLYFVVAYGILGSLPHSKSVRLAVNLEMIIAIFSILMLYKIFENISKGEEIGRRMMLAVLTISSLNMANFYHIFCKISLLDPISYHLLRIKHFIP